MNDVIYVHHRQSIGMSEGIDLVPSKDVAVIGKHCSGQPHRREPGNAAEVDPRFGATRVFQYPPSSCPNWE
ncbi:hypothetical protein L0M16_23300 [Mycolicibacterium sp. YH-1]|nr:hypothetical protein [Mycolicibacterium sp. YH-1]UNB50854.1 hypothetical protein L0M16_23300 [Mycolicibacterium sp. YH-1]